MRQKFYFPSILLLIFLTLKIQATKIGEKTFLGLENET